MKYFIISIIIHFISIHVQGEIQSDSLINKLKKLRPAGRKVYNFVPLTEIPPPKNPVGQNDRRNMPHEDCRVIPKDKIVQDAAKIQIMGDYYDERVEKKVVTVQIPEHIDHKHFQVTSSAPYLTVGEIEAIGYNPSTIRSDHPMECEKIYQDHLADQYSDEWADQSDESLEMARMPYIEPSEDNIEHTEDNLEYRPDKLYDDLLRSK